MKFFLGVCVLFTQATLILASVNTCKVNEYTKLIKLVSTPDGNHEKCSYESGFNFLHMTALPTDADYMKICAASNCYKFINEILADKAFNCILETGFKFNPYAIAKGYQPKCNKLGVKPLPECGKTAYEALITLIPQKPFTGCVKDADLKITSMNAYPTAEEYKKICSSENCNALMNQVVAYGKVLDCKYQVSNTKFHLNPLKFSSSVLEKCKNDTKDPLTNNCDGKVLLQLNKFHTAPELTGCIDDANFPLLEMKAFPTNAEYKRLCGSLRCKALVKNILAMGKQIDCDLDLHKLKYNPLKLAASFEPTCVSLEVSPTPPPSLKVTSSEGTKAPHTSSANYINLFFAWPAVLNFVLMPFML